VPLPLALLPAVIAIQLTLLRAAQVQSVGAGTVILPVPPLAENDPLAGEIAYGQGAPACVTVNICPAIVRVPVRELTLPFSATE
jgi:hypothetical protein